MANVEIDPLTGAPVTQTDPSVQSLPPTKTEVVKPSDEVVNHHQDKAASISGADVKDSLEPVQPGPSTVIGEVVRDENAHLTRAQFFAKVEDILKRYCSDNQSCGKALAEINLLVPSQE